MAVQERREEYSHAMIDCSDMTLTEYGSNGAHTYSIEEILKRWNGVPDIKITIRRSVALPADEE